ncbi:hypothetical protein EDC96DRAFT_544089 [Choanephora cucurbitarum]|nr:hypothetical protein EDC96DRAFT_544089 [Choanephora cucurbitarum]
MFEGLFSKRKKSHDEESVLTKQPTVEKSFFKRKATKSVHEEPSKNPKSSSAKADRSVISAPPKLTNNNSSDSQLHFYQGGVRKKHKQFVKWVGRVGFIAKGVVYGCIGVLTISNVTGAWTPNGSSGNESPQGAFLLLGGIPTIGRTILIIMAVGLVLYIIWRMWEAITGQGSDASFSKKKNFFRYRLSPFVSGLVYTAYAYYVIQMIFQTSEEQQATASSKTFPASWTGSTLGRAGIGLLGIAFLIAFTTQIINAVSGNFIQDLKTSEPGARKWEAFIIHTLGRIGFGGRAALFGTMSGFFWDSLAKDNESGEKNMVAAAVNKLATTGGGRFFMVILGLSLVTYALFAVLNAYYKYFPTPPPTRHEYYTQEVVHPEESSSSSSSDSEDQDNGEGSSNHKDNRKQTCRQKKTETQPNSEKDPKSDTTQKASKFSWLPAFLKKNSNTQSKRADIEKQ